MAGASPFFGRLVHCLAAMARNSTPRLTLIQFTTSDEVLPEFLEPPATMRTMTLTTTRPAIQPNANAGPFPRVRGVDSIKITAMIGTGLRATPTAEGRRSPMAWLSM